MQGSSVYSFPACSWPCIWRPIQKKTKKNRSDITFDPGGHRPHSITHPPPHVMRASWIGTHTCIHNFVDYCKRVCGCHLLQTTKQGPMSTFSWTRLTQSCHGVPKCILHQKHKETVRLAKQNLLFHHSRSLDSALAKVHALPETPLC